jgi:hypothetical protein
VFVDTESANCWERVLKTIIEIKRRGLRGVDLFYFESEYMNKNSQLVEEAKS